VEVSALQIQTMMAGVAGVAASEPDLPLCKYLAQGKFLMMNTF